MKKERAVLIAFGVGLAIPAALHAQSNTPAAASRAKSTRVGTVHVTGRRDDTPAKLDHILPEVAGTRITVTKKTNDTKLDQQPTVVGDDLPQLLVHSPGVLVGEAQTPSPVNLSYRGLGGARGSQSLLVLQDGVPITADWIGAPTLDLLPLSQGIGEVQEIRGGSSLLYGPGLSAINLVSKRPTPGGPLTGYTEQVGGSDGLYSTYNVLQGSQGKVDVRGDLGLVHDDGQRRNARSDVRQGDLYLAYRADAKQSLSLDLHAHDSRSGDPGAIGYAQFKSDPSVSPTPDNQDWVSRYSAVLEYDRDFAGGWRLEGKLWGAYEDLASRAAEDSPAPTGTTLQDALFRSEGLDLRLRDRWGRGDAFTIGVQAYHDGSPLRQWSSPDVLADRSDHDGTAILRQARKSDYEALFVENVFRLPWRFHVVPSVRIEHEQASVDESVRPPFLARPLLDADASRNRPLFGFGIGDDFGRQNETYFSVTQNSGPLRFSDVAPPFANLGPNDPGPNDPGVTTRSVDYELGVHGTPVTGLFYDAGLFLIEVDDRIETRFINTLDTVDQDSGDTRNRGFEGEASYDFLAARPGGRHLTAFANLQLLDARFTRSALPGQAGRTPAYSPHALGKYGVTFRQAGRYSLSLTGVSVSSQYFQDSDMAAAAADGVVPARIGGHTVLDVAGDWYLTRTLRVIGGVSNLGDVRYYAFATQNGVEPALGLTFHAGLALGF